MAPAVFLVQGIPLGEKVMLADVSPATVVTIGNRTDEERAFTIRIVNPAEAGARAWERGYESLPEPAWVRVEPATIVIPAQSIGKVRLITDFPKQDELAGRKFVAGLLLRPTVEEGVSIGLMGRILVELEPGKGRSGSAIALDKPVIEVGPVAPGTSATATVTITNTTNKPVAYRTGTIATTIGLPDTYARFATGGYGLVTDTTWTTPDPATFTLAAGQSIGLTVATGVPAGTPNGAYEDLVFIESIDGAPTGNDREPGGPTTFVRLRVQVGVAPSGTAPR
jgi:hypothetical protein